MAEWFKAPVLKISHATKRTARVSTNNHGLPRIIID
jgi:hypothetical protein